MIGILIGSWDGKMCDEMSGGEMSIELDKRR